MKHAVIIALIAAPLTVGAAAQDPAGEELDQVRPLPHPTEIQFTLSGGFEFGLSADLDRGGDVDVSRYDFSIAMQTRVEENLNLQASIGYGLDSYDFGGTSVFGATEPWEDIHTVRAGAIFSTELTTDWELYGGPFIGFSQESGADFDDSISGGGFVAVAKRFSDELTLGGGLGYTTEIEDSGRLFPIIALDWRITDDWRLAALSRANRSGLELIWAFDEGWEAGLAVGFSQGRFRLDDEGVAPDGVGEDKFTSIVARLSRDFSSSFRLDLLAGVNTDGEIELNSSSGGNIVRDDYDPALFFGLRGRIRF